MIPRPPQCDNDDCDYDKTGLWRHHAQCPTQGPGFEDMAFSTALEDGYAAAVVYLPEQRDRRAS